MKDNEWMDGWKSGCDDAWVEWMDDNLTWMIMGCSALTNEIYIIDWLTFWGAPGLWMIAPNKTSILLLLLLLCFQLLLTQRNGTLLSRKYLLLYILMSK